MTPDQPKPTGEWTVGTTVSGGDKYPAIMCKGKVVWFTCLSSDRNELRKLCRAHNASLAAEHKLCLGALAAAAESQKQLAAERDVLTKMLKAVDDYADEEGTDIIYGELRQKVESLVAKP